MVFIKAALYCAVILATVYLTLATADEEGPHESRSFLSLFPSVVSCNYTEQGGNTCLGCNQSLTCFSNNYGLLWNCGGLLPNCHEGHCSTVKPENCTTA